MVAYRKDYILILVLLKDKIIEKDCHLITWDNGITLIKKILQGVIEVTIKKT